MISLRMIGNPDRLGYFKSYRDIGEWLSKNGETGTYHAIPKNIVSIAGIKEIKVKKYMDEYTGQWEREVCMSGSYY